MNTANTLILIIVQNYWVLLMAPTESESSVNRSTPDRNHCSFTESV